MCNASKCQAHGKLLPLSQTRRPQNFARFKAKRKDFIFRTSHESETREDCHLRCTSGLCFLVPAVAAADNGDGGDDSQFAAAPVFWLALCQNMPERHHPHHQQQQQQQHRFPKSTSHPLLLELSISSCQLMVSGHFSLFAAPVHTVAVAMLGC